MVIFFINRFNDVDHLVPVAYKLAKDQKEELMILCLNPSFDVSNDFRLRFLAEKYNVQIDYQYKFYTPSIFHKFFALLLCNSYLVGGFRQNISPSFHYLRRRKRKKPGFINSIFHLMCGLFQSISRRLKISNTLIRLIYGSRWAIGMLTVAKPSALVFDHAAWPGLFNVGALLYAAKVLNIPTFDLPHGIPLYIKHPEVWNRAKSNLTKYGKDYIVLQHRWWRDECVTYGLNSRKVSILGSARFCSEWTGVLHKILPKDISLQGKGSGKLKVVYMEMGDRHDADLGVGRELLLKLNNLDFICLLVKPQTRNNGLHFDLPPNIYIARQENSVNLIKWADAVIVLFSSIMIEVLLQGKALIYPRFMHCGEMIWEKYGACWTVNNTNELISALKRLYENPVYRPYSTKSVEEYLTQVVYNGIKNNDVLEGYSNFILGRKREIW